MDSNSMTGLKLDEQGLLPAVIQDWLDGTVLMLGYMNQEAIGKTIATRSVHFWSRSRRSLWEKGETSGHKLIVKDLFIDCDRDTILVKAEQVGPTCHTGERACFFSRLDSQGRPQEARTTEASGGILDAVLRTIKERRAHPQAGSYTSKLFEGGQDKILKKVAEEAGEVLLAAKGGKKEEIIYETADLFFHALMVLGYHDITLQEILAELGRRFGKPGLRTANSGGAEHG
ncbi:Histidine biosynthesis bifunctional protein HisIE [Includes: Phosphoribosyl-AMP cyclohydrolase; Phosphoribosyl-ATP pyrophosphatase] [Nitrospira japonica]|uniref:Histidine biosynthesis bifunctional protein HisIE n=1 Tax=Nitrospira japonica TaxID=1325564 RepID=A0A1W1I9H0_9BACT|nr:bifunctional phosphoribosyl-AMP cyclohydrolase/phosphoribosyl-ATP diphosphatase HisIE [Nitrospira japonica]SLM49632.1 Histidine biosynthesis bifunctional protein HisIE [Includes: Phosphoribosyl-AMP cyclohydrolase; Phosphoribosyl-ATP pyrophosphatase] [Nitrospira japonica]